MNLHFECLSFCLSLFSRHQLTWKNTYFYFNTSSISFYKRGWGVAGSFLREGDLHIARIFLKARKPVFVWTVKIFHLCIVFVIVYGITWVVYDVDLLLVRVVHSHFACCLVVVQFCTWSGDWVRLLRWDLLGISTGLVKLLSGDVDGRRCIESSCVIVTIPQILLDVVVVERVAAFANTFEDLFINFRLGGVAFCFRAKK